MVEPRSNIGDESGILRRPVVLQELLKRSLPEGLRSNDANSPIRILSSLE